MAAQVVGCPTGSKGECRGDEENDNILGSRKKDTSLAIDGRDNVVGVNGNDTINGDPSADDLEDGAGSDTLNGDAADDEELDGDVVAQDGQRDVIDAGEGDDVDHLRRERASTRSPTPRSTSPRSPRRGRPCTGWSCPRTTPPKRGGSSNKADELYLAGGGAARGAWVGGGPGEGVQRLQRPRRHRRDPRRPAR